MSKNDVSKTLNSRPSYGDNANSDGSVVRRRSSSTQQPSWFSGLRNRISQISMPEWLSQLGIGTSQHADHRNSALEIPASISQTEKQNPSLPPIKEDTGNAQYVNEAYIFPEKYSSSTTGSLFDHSSVSLDEQNGESENFDWGWTIDSSVWNDEQGYSDTLIVQHFGPLKNLTTGCQQPGKGHNFQDVSVANPTWCDKCGDFMWGFLTHAVKCESCNYTCHAKCKILVTLDCKALENSIKMDSDDKPMPSIYPDIKEVHQISDEKKEPIKPSAPAEEKLNDEAFSGFVQIHMNFTRPINVVAGEFPPSFVDVVNSTGTATTKTLRTITTFFLPRNTVKNVNVSSQMTTREMIVTLLRKFKVADNPRKFALYERICNEKHDETHSQCRLIRVPDEAFPLRIAHSWVELGELRQLVLQENDTGDILWDMFEIPELENFLRILSDEEKHYSFRIRQKFDAYRFYLTEHLRSRGYTEVNDENELIFPSLSDLQDITKEQVSSEWTEC